MACPLSLAVITADCSCVVRQALQAVGQSWTVRLYYNSEGIRLNLTVYVNH